VLNVGQSGRTSITRNKLPDPVPSLAIFPTNLGWFGLLGFGDELVWIQIGHASADEVRRAARRFLGESAARSALRESDWNSELRHRLERYTFGERVDFADTPLRLPDGTEFQHRILKVTQRIPYGKTMSYGQLAAKAGYPRAARAVGSVMSSNRFPIVIPCHRVVAAGEKPGGYTSPQGVSLKVQLLALEAGATTH
jgi:methylated-DNA-[protein]-cysteine S-methyltransferase